MIRYVIYTNKEKVQEGELRAGEWIVGRSRSAGIHLPEPDVSGKHLKLSVASGAVFAENLSSHGTRLGETPLAERTLLKDGDLLVLSKSTEIRFEISADAGSAEDSADEGKTVIPMPGAPREKTAVPPVMKEDDGTKTRLPGTAVPAPASESPVPAAPQEPQEDKTEAGPAEKAAEEDINKTDVMRTRLASMEEMNILRNSDRKRTAGKKLKYILAAAAAIGLLVLLYSLRPTPREASLTWPLDAAGKEMGDFCDPGNGGYKAGGFSLAFPSIKGKTKITKEPGKLRIDTWFGKDASVPLRVLFLEKQSADFLTMERKDVFTRLLSELQAEDRHWNLSQISDVFFIGSENGLPCLSCEYRREEGKRSWYGEILFFRTGDKAYMRLAETWVSERARGQNFISNTPFLKISQQYLREHWEGGPECAVTGKNTAAMLDEVSRHLSKQAPFEWARTDLLLRIVLAESFRTGNEAERKTALSQLQRLRAMQTVWYNSQKIQYNAAKLEQDKHRENAVMELCKTVFSSPDDLRYFTLRRNVWE